LENKNMTNTIEGFRPHAEQGRVEQGKQRRESFFSKIGKFVRRELGFQSSEVRSASDSFRAHAAQLQEQNPHRDPTAVRQIHTIADRVDLGHHSNLPSPEARFQMANPSYGEQRPMVVEGQVVDVSDHVPSPRTHDEGMSESAPAQQEQYGRYDSSKTAESAVHDTSVSQVEQPFKSMEGSLAEPNESEIIGTDAWHEAQSTKTPEHNPNDVSIGTDVWHKAQEKTFVPNPHEVSIGENRWAKGDEAKAIVQEQQTRIQEQAARAEARAEDHSGDELWQARKARQARLLRMEKSIRPGEYTPEVIDTQPTNEDSKDQKAA
jgi:hypothetical protein